MCLSWIDISLRSDGLDYTSTGRHFNMATRHKHYRQPFLAHGNGVHQKLNLELVKLKIESHYRSHKRVSSQSQPQPQSQSQSQLTPPPIPSTRPSLAVFQKRSESISISKDQTQNDWTSNDANREESRLSVSSRKPSLSLSLNSDADLGIPLNSLRQLAMRPLPIIPDRQVCGAIIRSPTNDMARERFFEPKEEREESLITVKKNEVELMPMPDRRCVQCNQMVTHDKAYVNCGQSYCRPCFGIVFCCCAGCGQLVEPGHEFLRLTGIDDPPAIESRIQTVATIEEIEEMSKNVTNQHAESILYHYDCIKCQHCIESVSMQSVPSDELIPQESHWFQHAGRFYCQQEYARLFGVNCAQCHQFIADDRIDAVDQSWHAKCFVCAAGNCGRVLTSDSYYLSPPELVSPPMSPTASAAVGVPIRANRSAYCASCFQSTFQCCHFCSEPIRNEERAIHVKHAQTKRAYHQRCYQCVICLTINSIDDKLYAGEDDECLYCYQHYVWKFIPKCPACDEPFVDTCSSPSNSITLTVNGVEYHQACVKCFVCSTELHDGHSSVYAKLTECSPTEENETQILLCHQHQAYEHINTAQRDQSDAQQRATI